MQRSLRGPRRRHPGAAGAGGITSPRKEKSIECSIFLPIAAQRGQAQYWADPCRTDMLELPGPNGWRTDHGATHVFLAGRDSRSKAPRARKHLPRTIRKVQKEEPRGSLSRHQGVGATQPREGFGGGSDHRCRDRLVPPSKRVKQGIAGPTGMPYVRGKCVETCPGGVVHRNDENLPIGNPTSKNPWTHTAFWGKSDDEVVPSIENAGPCTRPGALHGATGGGRGR